jgi:hypothetical protein
MISSLLGLTYSLKDGVTARDFKGWVEKRSVAGASAAGARLRGANR